MYQSGLQLCFWKQSAFKKAFYDLLSVGRVMIPGLNKQPVAVKHTPWMSPPPHNETIKQARSDMQRTQLRERPVLIGSLEKDLQLDTDTETLKKFWDCRDRTESDRARLMGTLRKAQVQMCIQDK